MNTTQADGESDQNKAQAEYMAMMRAANSTEAKERNLIDWFAGLAMQGMMANPECNAMAGQDVARNSYRMGNEMLAVRKEML